MFFDQNDKVFRTGSNWFDSLIKHTLIGKNQLLNSQIVLLKTFPKQFESRVYGQMNIRIVV